MSTLDKDSSVKLRLVLELHRGSAWIFWALSIQGRWVPIAGGYRKLGKGERSVAIRLTRRQRENAARALGISVKRIENAASGWVAKRHAHRCKGALTLFTSPLRGPLDDLSVMP